MNKDRTQRDTPITQRDDTAPPAHEEPRPPARSRELDEARRRERARRVGAAQMAAPSTRRWRRARRFDRVH